MDRAALHPPTHGGYAVGRTLSHARSLPARRRVHGLLRAVLHRVALLARSARRSGVRRDGRWCAGGCPVKRALGRGPVIGVLPVVVLATGCGLRPWTPSVSVAFWAEDVPSGREYSLPTSA